MRLTVLLPLIGAAALGLVLPLTGGAQVGGSRLPIRLKAATFDPLEAEPTIAARLRHRGLAQGERGTYIVQFVGPIEDSWKAAVSAAGGELLEYVPENAFKVRMTPSQSQALRRLANVRWVGPFHPAYKLSPRLTRNGERLYVVRLEPGSDSGRAASAIQSTGARVGRPEGRSLLVAARPEQLDALAAVDDVAWVENWLPRKRHNDQGGGVILGAATANSAGYDGSTQTVAIADTGIGGGTASTAHAHIPASRVAAIHNWPGVPDVCFETIVDDQAKDVDTGHGTHVSVSALGDGGTTGFGKGTAPAGRLLFQAVENYAQISDICQLVYGLFDGYYLTGIPADVGDLFQQAYSGGARVHSNSWGSDVAGQYTTDSVNADDFVWSHKDLTITFSAGNAGVDANADGGVDGDSMGAPATAKNVISVGASENDRASNYPCDVSINAVCAAQGGQNDIFTWFEGFPFEFPAEPLKSDPSAGNAEQMAAFSSRGPTDDGRIKPDVVAPGSWVLSGYSDLYQGGYDPSPNPQTGQFQYDGWGFPLNNKLKYLGGTSMSTPLVAGGAAVVRDFYQELHSHAASAALVKATLVNSAQDLLDEDNDGFNNNARPIPNFYEGWGRVDLAAATDGDRRFVDQATGLSTGGVASVTYDVSAGTPFKVTLAWSDYPGNPSATKMLVNNLDLEVSGPGGAFFRGNVFGGGWSIAGGLADNTNNVENVYVQAPVAGQWTVTVRGFNVPQGPQPYALAVSGQISEEPPGVAVPVIWDAASATGVTIGGNSLTKTAPNGWGNAGAVSIQQIESGEGHVEVTASETTTFRMIGLSNGNSNASHTDIDFALYLSQGQLKVFEGGAQRGTFGSYVTGDALRVAVVGGQVRYSKNGSVVYTSTGSPTYPLLVDTALYSVGATLNAVMILGGAAPPPPPPPPPPGSPVIWTAVVGATAVGNSLTKTAATGWGNSGAVSTQQIESGDGHVQLTASETTTFRMIGLSNGNSSASYTDIDFALYLSQGQLKVFEGGTQRGTFGTYSTGDTLRVAVVGGQVQYSRNESVFYTSSGSPSYPLLVDTALNTLGATLNAVMIQGGGAPPPPPPPPPPGSPVTWTSIVGSTAVGNSLTKTAVTGWGNSGAVSTQQIASGDGHVQLTASETTTFRMIGLSNGNSSASYTDIDFALYLSQGQLKVFEGGTQRGTFGTYSTGDTLRVAVVGGQVEYSRNESVFYTSTGSPSYPLLVDAALHTSGATLTNVLINP